MEFLDTEYKWVKPFEKDEIVFVRNGNHKEWVERKFFSEEHYYFWAYEEISDQKRKLKKWKECKREGENVRYTKYDLSKDDNDGCELDYNRERWYAMTDGNYGDYKGGTSDWDH